MSTEKQKGKDKQTKILFIDNFDSFTYNLVDEFKLLNCNIVIYRNNITMEQLEGILKDFAPDLIVLSPGPSHPKDAGICIPLLKKYYKEYPILGVCLGHQAMIEAFGGRVNRAPECVHGKQSTVIHTDTPLFAGIPKHFKAGRYHSLYGSKIPDEFEVSAKADHIPMAIEHKEHRLMGVQFHPESILTTQGSILMKNILKNIVQ